MACHEIAALRLGLMKVLGRNDEADRQHELAELGGAVEAPGPLRSMCHAGDLGSLLRFYDASVALLEERIARTRADDPKLAYLRTLVVLTKKIELDLHQRVEALSVLYRDLEQMHDFVHEIYPAD